MSTRGHSPSGTSTNAADSATVEPAVDPAAAPGSRNKALDQVGRTLRAWRSAKDDADDGPAEIAETAPQLGPKIFRAKSAEETAMRKEIDAEGAELVKQYKREDGVGTGAGRSGGHGTPHKRAGAEMIRRGNALPKNDPRKEIYKTVGNRLIEQGKSHDHPGS